MAIGSDFESAHAGCSLPISNHPDTCDSVHVTNLNALDVVPIAAVHTIASFKVLAT